ncbi:YczE/YyaS/YitT family protein [Evansella clarkii]|uniref:YczE/YyaS/YitT family protein n=1 Tax=Evansella clarkii TaxID=79879 RepID=UPI000996DBEE|nr:YitT family protein [Evansella clarkii]
MRGLQTEKQTDFRLLFRWGIFIIGLIIMSLGISLTILAGLGSAPWDVLHIGLTEQLGLTVGTWTIIMGFLLLVAATILTKEKPKLGAYLNMLLVGLFVDFFLFVLPQPDVLLVQALMLTAGILVMGFGIGVYISPQCGAGPRDSLMLAVAERTRFTVAQVRVTMEVIVLFFGWLLGGPVFIGTILFSLTIGHVTGVSLTWCRTWVDRRMERGIKIENIN